MDPHRYVTRGGLEVVRKEEPLALPGAVEPLVDALDTRRGVLLASSYEYPGRYSRWVVGFVDPPLVLEVRGRELLVTALNDRGGVLLPAIGRALEEAIGAASVTRSPDRLTARVPSSQASFAEEDRSKQ